MRYFKHLALWSVCGAIVVGFAGALAGAIVGGTLAWAMSSPTVFLLESRSADILSGVGGGIDLGAYSGAICGFVALLCLAIPRPRLQGKGAARLRKALLVVGGFVALGTPVLSVGFSLVALGLMRLLARASHSEDLNDVFGWIFYAHFLLVAFPALVGALAATRTLRRFEKDAPRVLPQSLL